MTDDFLVAPRATVPLQIRLQRIRRTMLLTAFASGFVVLLIFLFVPVDDKVKATGFVVAETTRFVHAPEATVLRSVESPEGTDVKSGDIIMTLDSTAHESQLAQVQAQIVEAIADMQLKQAQFEKIAKLPLPEVFWHIQDELSDTEKKAAQAGRDRDRYKEMYDRKLVSRVEYEARQLASDLANSALAKVRENAAKLNDGVEDSIIKEAMAQTNSVRAKIDALKVEERLCLEQIERCRIRAPIDGRVTYLAKRYIGEPIARGERLAHVSSGPPNRVKLAVGESQMHRVKPGQRVRIVPHTFDTFKWGEVEGHIEEVSAEPMGEEDKGAVVAPENAMYRVTAHIDSTPVPLVLGSTLDAQIVLERKPVWKIILPISDRD